MSDAPIMVAQPLSAVAPASRQAGSYWQPNYQAPVNMIAYNALETRPDYDQIERLWTELDRRFKFARDQYREGIDAHPLFQTDLYQLASDADLDADQLMSHLYTLQGCGLLAAVNVFAEIDAVSLVIAPHMIAKPGTPQSG